MLEVKYGAVLTLGKLQSKRDQEEKLLITLEIIIL